MCIEHAFCQRTGLKQRKAEQNRIAHASPDRFGYVCIHGDISDKHGVDRHADDDSSNTGSRGACL